MHVLLGAFRVFAVVMVAGVLGVTMARASSIPATALSQSTGIDPTLLEQVELLYRFPQMALADSQSSAGPHFTGLPLRSGLFATTGSGGTSPGLGVLARGSSLAVFALTQPSYVGTSTDRFEIDGSSQIMQAGVGLRAGAVRFGAALRGTWVRTRSGSEDLRPGQLRSDFREADLDYLEGGVGCGADLGRTRIELNAEVPHRTSETGGLQINSSDTLGARLQTYPHQAWNLAGRVSRPLGARAHIVASAGYEHGELEWTGQIYTANTTRDTSITQALEGWSAAVSVAITTTYLDVIAVSARFSRHLSPNGIFDSNGFIRADHDLEDGSVAFSVGRHIWRSVMLFANVQTRYSRSEYETVFGRASFDAPRIDRSSNDSMGQSFGWGASYAYERCRFFGALNSPPSLTSPVATLDLQIGF